MNGDDKVTRLSSRELEHGHQATPVRVLERTLQRAIAGEIEGVIVLTKGRDGRDDSTWMSTGLSATEALGSLEFAKLAVLDDDEIETYLRSEVGPRPGYRGPGK